MPPTEQRTRPRGRFAALAVSLLIGLAGCGDEDEVPPPPDGGPPAASCEGDGPLAAAGAPEPLGLRQGDRVKAGKVELAKEDRFEVFAGEVLELRPPIDWASDPIGARRFRQTFLKLRWLNPLVDAYRVEGDVEALERAAAIVLDFVTANPRGGEETPAETWTDKVAGDRVPYIGYIGRAASCEGLLEADEEQAFLGSLAEHGQYLADPEIYIPDNHGLYVDLGLELVSLYAPMLDQAAEWDELARERFAETLTGLTEDGVWLEHSSSYQFLVLRGVDGMLKVAGDDQRLKRLHRQMRSAAGWMVLPDGEMGQFGDSYQVELPNWAAKAADRTEGLRFFEGAGLAIVRDREANGYLSVMAAFHALNPHKHADELGFELYDHGMRVVADTGLYHKDPSPERDFVLSAPAHSVLTVDGQNFPIADASLAYGSALDAVGEADGWYAILGHNPLVEPQRVTHERLFLYRPGESLIVCDRVESASMHTYTRYLQLGPRVDFDLATQALLGEGRLADTGADPSADVTAVRGSRDPLGGLTSPDFRVWVDRWTVALETVASTAAYATTLALSAEAPVAEEIIWEDEEVTVELSDGVTVRATLADRISLEATP